MKKSKKITTRSFEAGSDENNLRSPDNSRARSADSYPVASQTSDLHGFFSSYEALPFKEGFADDVLASIRENTVDPAPKLTVIHFFRSPYLVRYAAVFLLLIGTGVFMWSRTQTYSAPYGSQATKVLPDDSRVQLNSGSVLTYRTFLGRSERRVYLEGEAFFSVEPSDKPFIVETFNAEVRVLGTRFNVFSWPDSLTNYTVVTLEEGKVAVSSLNQSAETAEILPMESIMIHSDSMRMNSSRLTPKDVEHALSWREGGYRFQYAPLGFVAKELERRHNLSLELSPELRKLPITYLNPNSISLEDVLEDLSSVHAFSFRRTANGFELFYQTSPTQ